MRMPVICQECLNESGTVDDIPPGGIPIEMQLVPVQTVGLYRAVCPHKHNIVMVADFQQFELLFESAMEAFADGYFREAVSAFAAALERYYEFAIATFLIARGIEVATISGMWKSVSNQSERQLGMLIGLYTSAYGRSPTLMPTDQIKFRNNVIHKGHFPLPDETLAFGNHIYSLLKDGIKELRSHFDEAMQKARDIARLAALAQVKTGEIPGTFGMVTTISLMSLDEPPPIAKAIATVAARIHRHRNVVASEVKTSETSGNPAT